MPRTLSDLMPRIGENEKGRSYLTQSANQLSKEQISRRCPLDLHPRAAHGLEEAGGQDGVAAP